MSTPHVPGHTMTMAVTRRLADIAVSCTCRERGDHLETRPVLPAREAYRLWLEHVKQAQAVGSVNALTVRILAAVAMVLTLMARAHLSFPAALIAVAAGCAACLLLAVLIAMGIGRLAESAPRYRTTLYRSTA